MFTLLSHGSDVTEDIHSTMFWLVEEQTREDEDESLRCMMCAFGLGIGEFFACKSMMRFKVKKGLIKLTI